jgi:hypothetical protein
MKMKRRRNRFESSADSPAPAPVSKEPESSVIGEDSKAKDKYRDLSADADFTRKAGLSDEAEKKIAVVVIPDFKPEDLLIVIDFYAVVISFIFSRALNAKFEMVHKICKFDDDQRKVVSECLSPVVGKYFPQDWIAYLPEIKLGLCLVGITTAKFTQTLEAVKSATIDAEKAKTV